MTPEDTYETPLDTEPATENPIASSDDVSPANSPDDVQAEAEMNAANEAFESQPADAEPSEATTEEGTAAESVSAAEASSNEQYEDVVDTDDAVEIDEETSVKLAQPFVGQWNTLISTTNWEKGRIIAEWRQALIDSGVDSSQYSDEAWTRRVGGVTAPHVGRLRRVHERFASTYQSYDGVYWSHFLAALDWDDAALWLEGAAKEKWSVSVMREQRWQALGAVESNRPTGSQVVEVDTDEDVVLPAQGEGRTKEYGDDSGVAAGPTFEGPDFGEEEELMSLGGSEKDAGAAGVSVVDPDQPANAPVQPFAGLPELPDDLSDAVESFKLALLRHKTSGWNQVSAETLEKYLQAFAVLLAS